jgi:hypothetical protein
MEMSPAAGVIEEWVNRFDLMRNDVQELLLRHKVFNRLQEIVAANPRLHHPSYLYDYLEGTYAASTAAGIRRHVRFDDPERDASLLGLLYASSPHDPRLGQDSFPRFHDMRHNVAAVAMEE